MDPKSMSKRLQLYWLFLTVLGIVLVIVGDAIERSIFQTALRTLGIASCGLGFFALGYLKGASRKAKKCPQCGKMVNLFDKVCRFCMYWFEDERRD